MYIVNIQLWTHHLLQVPWFDPTSVCRHLAQAGLHGEGAEGFPCLAPLVTGSLHRLIWARPPFCKLLE